MLLFVASLFLHPHVSLFSPYARALVSQHASAPTVHMRSPHAWSALCCGTNYAVAKEPNN